MADRIGRFEILAQIGEGGMGTVFKARDPHINRIVAIKLLRDGFDSHEMRERFMQEARTAGGLQNPYIVTIFELGEHENAPFIVMEFLVGHPLDRLIKNKAAISVVRKLELMEALCTGLSAAHRAGVIHRDIKPPNLMVLPDGLLKILDFGIARVGASEMTKVGMVIGTPNYMSPEQLNAEAIDKRTDIFAVGAVFYELFTYERAFPGNHTEAITKILTRDPAPLAKLCPGLDPAIEAIVAKALKKNPRERYQDLSEMRREIIKIRERLERDSPPESLIETLSADTIAAEDDPGAPASSRVRSEMRRRAFAEVDAARRLFDQGAVAEALQRLEQFSPPNEFVSEALAALRERAEELDREARRSTAIARALKAAGEAFDRGDFAAAIRASDEALLIDERLTDARNLRRRAHNALDEQRRQAALKRRVGDTLAEARWRFAAGERLPALHLLTSFEPPHPEIAALRDELQVAHEAIEEAARVREAERRRQEQERLAREAEERRAREEAARLAKAEAARRQREIERAAKAEAARVAKIEAERREREAAEQAARELAARQAREEADRRRQEQERLARQEADRRAREEAARLAKEREEAARLAKEREEAARLAKQREEAAQLAKVEGERAARAEAERAKAERERLARIEAERREREAAEQAARLAKEREAAARLAKEREAAARLAKERETAARLAKEREAAAQLAKEEAQRREREAAEQAARELAAQRAREAADRARKANAERVAKIDAARAAATARASQQSARSKTTVEPATARASQQSARSKTAVEPARLPAPTRSQLVGGAAALLLVAAVAGGLWKYRSPAPETAQPISAPAPATTIATTTVPPPAANPADGTLALDALPWAQVVRITNSDGKPQPLPDNATTPLTLSLPPGMYDVTLKNGSTRTFRAQVGAGQIAQPTPVDFGQIDAADYFRKLGW